MPPQKGLVLSLFLFLNYIALARSCDVDCCSDCRPNQGSYVNKNKDVKISRSSLLIKITRKTQRKRTQSTGSRSLVVENLLLETKRS